jgi:hypothetical protein
VAWPSGRTADIGPVPHPDGPTLAPHGGPSFSRTIDQGPAPVRSPGRLAPRKKRVEVVNRTAGRGVGIVPTPLGAGRGRLWRCPAPWPVAGAGDPDAMAEPDGLGTAARPPVLLSDNPVVCHTTKCVSGTISSPRTWNP